MISTSIPCATSSSTWPDWLAASPWPSVTVTDMPGNHFFARSGICCDETAPYGYDVALFHDTPTSQVMHAGSAARASCAVASSPQ